MIPHVLISSAGRRGELLRIFQQSLADWRGEGSVFAIDRSALTAAGWLSSGVDTVPAIAEDGFIPATLEVCRRRQIRHLVPTIDTELSKYAAAREHFEAIGTTVWVSDPATISISQSKRATNAWLRANGFPCPQQWDLADALRAPDLTFPAIAKPSGGSASVGVARVDRRRALEVFDPALDYVVERIAPGAEYTVDVACDWDGTPLVAVPRQRLETRGGEVSKGITVADTRLTELATAVVAALPGARGVLNVQMFMDAETGVMNVIEINARFGGGFPLTRAAGADVPGWLMAAAEGEAPTQSLAWEPGTVMLRYDSSVIVRADQVGLA